MTDFEQMDISLSAGMLVGEGANHDVEGAQLQAVIQDRGSADYQHMATEDKIRMADVMIARWQRYRTLVLDEAESGA